MPFLARSIYYSLTFFSVWIFCAFSNVAKLQSLERIVVMCDEDIIFHPTTIIWEMGWDGGGPYGEHYRSQYWTHHVHGALIQYKP